MKWNIRYVTKIEPRKLIPWNLPGLKKKRQKSDQERTSTQRHFRIWQVVRQSIFNSIKTYWNLWNGILVTSCVLADYITNQFWLSSLNQLLNLRGAFQYEQEPSHWQQVSPIYTLIDRYAWWVLSLTCHVSICCDC